MRSTRAASQRTFLWLAALHCAVDCLLLWNVLLQLLPLAGLGLDCAGQWWITVYRKFPGPYRFGAVLAAFSASRA